MESIKKIIKASAIYKSIACAAFVALLAVCLPADIVAKETAGNQNAAPAKSEDKYSQKLEELMQFLSGKSDPFVYRRDGRSDPFMPFVSEKVIASDMEIPEEELVGMQKFEPGQLTLVAVVLTETGPMAMVQDSIGIGYILRTGTKIGRSGVVDEISSNLVVVKQSYKTTAGEERYKVVEMLLKKEGEQ